VCCSFGELTNCQAFEFHFRASLAPRCGPLLFAAMVAPGERRGLQPESNTVLAAAIADLQDGECRVLEDLVLFRVGPASYHAVKAWRDASSDFTLIHALCDTPESAASCQAVQKLLGQALVKAPKQSLASAATARGTSSNGNMSNCTASYSRSIDTRLLQPLTAVRARSVLAQIAGAYTQVLAGSLAQELKFEFMMVWRYTVLMRCF
jgi:hypothetical protein